VILLMRMMQNGKFMKNNIVNSNCTTSGSQFNPTISDAPDYEISQLGNNHEKLTSSGSFTDEYIQLYGDNSIIEKSIVVGPIDSVSSCCTITQLTSKLNAYQIVPRYNVDAIINALNEYRKDHQYPAIPISVSLMTSSQFHANMILQYPETISATCGSFSWPEPPITGLWKSCCYSTADGISSTCVRYKSDEITSNWNYPYGNVVWFSTVKISEAVSSPERVVVDAWLADSKVKRCLIETDCMGSVWTGIGVGIASDEYSQVRAYLYLSTSVDKNIYNPYTTNTTLPDSDTAALAYASVENPVDPRSMISTVLIITFSVLALIILVVIIVLLFLICRDSSTELNYTEMESDE